MPGRGQPKKYKTATELSTKIDEYFEYSDTNNKPYTVLGMCIYLDIHRETIRHMEEYGKDYFDTLKSAKEKIENYSAELLFDKNSNTVGVIFNLKNNFKWTDRLETNNDNNNINHNNDLKGKTADEIAAMINDLKNKTK